MEFRLQMWPILILFSLFSKFNVCWMEEINQRRQRWLKRGLFETDKWIIKMASAPHTLIGNK